MSKLCQVLHAGGKELRLVVHDAGIVEHVEELLDVLVGEIGHEDGLYQCRVGLYAALLAHLHCCQSLLNGSSVGLQQVAEGLGHDAHRGVELHLVLQLLEEVEDGLALVFYQEVLRAGLRGNEEAGIAVGIALEVGDELTQDAVGNAGVERRLLQGLGLGREVIVVVPVLAAAQSHNLPLYLLLLLRCLFDGFGQFLQQTAALLNVLLGHGIGPHSRRTVAYP